MVVYQCGLGNVKVRAIGLATVFNDKRVMSIYPIACVNVAGIADDRVLPPGIYSVVSVRVAGIAADRAARTCFDAVVSIREAGIAYDRAARMSIDAVLSVIVAVISAESAARTGFDTVLSIAIETYFPELTVPGMPGINPTLPPVSYGAITNSDVVIHGTHRDVYTTAARTCFFTWSFKGVTVEVEGNVVCCDRDTIRIQLCKRKVARYDVGA